MRGVVRAHAHRAELMEDWELWMRAYETGPCLSRPMSKWGPVAWPGDVMHAAIKEHSEWRIIP